MKETNNAKKNGISMQMLIGITVIDILILIAWIIGVLSGDKGNWGLVMKELPAVLENLSAFSVAIFGVNVVRKGLFEKGGTEYYPTKYGEKVLNSILDKCGKYEGYDEVIKTIEKLLESKSKEPHDSEYFRYVNYIKLLSDDFDKVWNDYNFYSAKKNKKEKEKKYYKRLQMYIFIKVYDEYKKGLENTHKNANI